MIGQFLDSFQVAILNESESWWRDLIDIAEQLPDVRGNEVFDARIALCLRHNGIRHLWSLDSDFEKYSFLKRVKEGGDG